MSAPAFFASILLMIAVVIALAFGLSDVVSSKPSMGYCKTLWGDKPDGWHSYEAGVRVRCVAGVPLDIRR